MQYKEIFKHRSYLKYLLGILIFVFILIQILTQFDYNSFSKIEFNIINLLLSMILLLISLIIQHTIWYLIILNSNPQISYFQIMRIRIYAELGKYVPGRVALYGMLFNGLKRHGISVKLLTSYSIIEAAVSMISAVIVSFIALSFSGTIVPVEIKYWSFVLLFVLLIFSYPKILSFIINIPLKLLKKEIIQIKISYYKIIAYLTLGSLTWSIYGVSFYFLMSSFADVGISKIWIITGSFALSSFFGFLAFFVPAGLGVREGILIFFLKDVFGNFISGITSLLSRLLLISGDLILATVVFLYQRLKRN